MAHENHSETEINGLTLEEIFRYNLPLQDVMNDHVKIRQRIDAHQNPLAPVGVAGVPGFGFTNIVFTMEAPPQTGDARRGALFRFAGREGDTRELRYFPKR